MLYGADNMMSIVLLKNDGISFRPKHPLKVHVWGGISLRGPTGLCVFEGKMDAEMYLYVGILKSRLKPFIDKVYPDSHRLMQDNNPNTHQNRLQHCCQKMDTCRVF
jgi:hypothetical protein